MQERLRQFCIRLSGILPTTFLESSDTRSTPLDGLIATILSQHTSDTNSRRAFDRLKVAFPSWQTVIDAPQSQVEAAISCGGLAKIKSARIQEVLRIIVETNPEHPDEPSLDFLRKLDLAAARSYLMSLPGVGRKTADCVLLFTLALPACPVDTHVHRVARRLGLADIRATADQTAEALDAILPKDCMLTFHIGCVRVGRTTCRPQKPNCPECILDSLCLKKGV